MLPSYPLTPDPSLKNEIKYLTHFAITFFFFIHFKHSRADPGLTILRERGDRKGVRAGNDPKIPKNSNARPGKILIFNTWYYFGCRIITNSWIGFSYPITPAS